MRFLLLCYLLGTAFFFLVSCIPEDMTERFSIRGEQTETSHISSLIEADDYEPEPQSASQLVLESGNHWTSGIPGFRENALSAFTGEYRISGKTETVRVWLTREFLYYEGWTEQNNINAYANYRRSDDTSDLTSVQLDENWTLVINFPPALTGSQEEQDRLLQSFVGRIGGMSRQSQNISLPAIIPY